MAWCHAGLVLHIRDFVDSRRLTHPLLLRSPGTGPFCECSLSATCYNPQFTSFSMMAAARVPRRSLFVQHAMTTFSATHDITALQSDFGIAVAAHVRCWL